MTLWSSFINWYQGLKSHIGLAQVLSLFLELGPEQGQEEYHDGHIDKDDHFYGQLFPYPSGHDIAKMEEQHTTHQSRENGHGFAERDQVVSNKH